MGYAPLRRGITPVLLLALPIAAGAQQPRTANRAVMRAPVVEISTNRGRMVTLTRPMTDIFVANSGIADVQVRSPTQLYIFGKSPGETTISATSRTGGVVYAATVRVGNNFESLAQMLKLAMPEAAVTATTLNGIVLLTGTVAQPDDAAEAERLVTAFVGEQTKVISRLKTATPLQVNLQVRFAEVNRTFAKNIGANLSSFDATGGFRFGLSQGRPFFNQFAPRGPLFTGGSGTPPPGSSGVTQPSGSTTFGLAGRLLGLDLLGALDLGERLGQVTSLANPNLTALSGETGTFLAGGEVPIPVGQGLGAISVEYKQYGVSLAYTPVVLAGGRISLRVRPEVSQLDYSNAVTIDGSLVPSLTSRRTETTVELGSGQSFMIAGLLQNTHNNSFQKTPGAGDVPILGALFRSNAFQRNETELVIVITPYLVKPVDASRIALPTDGYHAPTDLERVFLGTLGNGTSGASRPVPTMAPAPPAGAPPPPGAAVPPLAVPATAGRRRAKATPAPNFSD